MTRPSVLIVDDNARLLRGLARLLGDEFRVSTAVSAAEAIAMLADGSFDILLADHQMPGIQGVQLLANAKQNHPHVALILMSGEITPKCGIWPIMNRRLSSYRKTLPQRPDRRGDLHSIRKEKDG